MGEAQLGHDRLVGDAKRDGAVVRGLGLRAPRRHDEDIAELPGDALPVRDAPIFALYHREDVAGGRAVRKARRVITSSTVAMAGFTSAMAVVAQFNINSMSSAAWRALVIQHGVGAVHRIYD